MEEKLSFALPAPVCHILHLLQEQGHEGFLVGGCVRDFLRGIPPQDYDLTTSATPDEMHRVFAGLRTVDTGVRHGTVTVLFGGMSMEVTTYRVDGTYADNRHPTAVRFTRSLREDAARRDFTVNAMAYHPDLGLRDYFGGYDDLRARVLRAVGDPLRRFEEDALRILRALRFSAVLGFAIEEKTAAAAFACASRLSSVSAERIRVELQKMLCGDHVGAVLSAYAPILSLCLPGWGAQLQEGSLAGIAAALGRLPSEPAVRFAALLSPLAPDAADRLMTDLRFDNRTRLRVRKLLAHRADPCTADMAVMRRFLSGVGAEDAPLLLSLRLALLQTAREPDREEIARLLVAQKTLSDLLQAGTCTDLRDLAISGKDLQAIGYLPGKKLGQALSAALSAVLDGRVENEREALLSFCKKYNKTE